jgi:pimeloyl-ACP methyl ester carboxylesterase
MRSEIKSADGTRIRWLAAGEGPPFVLVPGGFGDEHTFDPLVTQLTVDCVASRSADEERDSATMRRSTRTTTSTTT